MECYTFNKDILGSVPKNRITVNVKDINEYLLSLSQLSEESKEYKAAKGILQNVTFIHQEEKILHGMNKALAIIAGNFPAYLARQIKTFNRIAIYIVLVRGGNEGYDAIGRILCELFNVKIIHFRLAHTSMGFNTCEVVLGRLKFIWKVHCNLCLCEFHMNNFFFSEGLEYDTQRYRLVFFPDRDNFKAISKYMPMELVPYLVVKTSWFRHMKKMNINYPEKDFVLDLTPPSLYQLALLQYGKQMVNKNTSVKYSVPVPYKDYNKGYCLFNI